MATAGLGFNGLLLGINVKVLPQEWGKTYNC